MGMRGTMMRFRLALVWFGDFFAWLLTSSSFRCWLYCRQFICLHTNNFKTLANRQSGTKTIEGLACITVQAGAKGLYENIIACFTELCLCNIPVSDIVNLIFFYNCRTYSRPVNGFKNLQIKVMSAPSFFRQWWPIRDRKIPLTSKGVLHFWTWKNFSTLVKLSTCWEN